MTSLAAVPQPGDPHARPGNHPKEPAVTYTHIDVELVARALHNHPGDTPFDYYDDAKRALDALAAAGRLLPDGSWAVPKVPIEHEGWLTADGRVESMVFDANQDTLSPAEAREFAALYLAAADAAEARRD